VIQITVYQCAKHSSEEKEGELNARKGWRRERGGAGTLLRA